jgi:DNA-binding GntR family transcriptional regulator
MPKKYGVKEKDQVVAHIVNLVLTGKLRSGDRLDRNEIAEELGLSRAPVQEAVIQLEHDGILSTRYHRGAYVERFDHQAVLEHHELDGVLNGIASARAAADPTDDLTERLGGQLEIMRNRVDSKGFQHSAAKFRRAVNDAHAGPRLQAAIRAASTLMPRTFWKAYPDSHDQLLPFYEAEFAAITGGEPDQARAACEGRSRLMGRIMLAELVRRGVLPPAPEDHPRPLTL